MQLKGQKRAKSLIYFSYIYECFAFTKNKKGGFIMKKPENKRDERTDEKKGIKEFWANKNTRWTIFAFLAVIVITVVQFFVLSAK